MAKNIPSKTEIGFPGHEKQHISRKWNRGKWNFHLKPVHFHDEETKQQSWVGANLAQISLWKHQLASSGHPR
jgi:hypothetical protein